MEWTCVMEGSATGVGCIEKTKETLMVLLDVPVVVAHSTKRRLFAIKKWR